MINDKEFFFLFNEFEKILKEINQNKKKILEFIDHSEIPTRELMIEEIYKKIITNLSLDHSVISIIKEPSKLIFKGENIKFKISKLMENIKENEDNPAIKRNLILKFLEEFKDISENDRLVLAETLTNIKYENLQNSIEDLLKNLKLLI